MYNGNVLILVTFISLSTPFFNTVFSSYCTPQINILFSSVFILKKTHANAKKH